MRRWVAGLALVVAAAWPAGAQPVPIPEVVPETPVIRPTIPVPALTVGTSSGRAPAAAGAIEPTEALVRTG